jgi:hypothetical protein
MEDIAETYRKYSNEDLAALHGEMDSLTEEARRTLLSEIQGRGLNDKALAGLRSERAERAAQVNREWPDRKPNASRMLINIAVRIGIAMGIVVILALIVLIKSCK